MSPVDVECAECKHRFAVSISKVDEDIQRCPRCGQEEVLIAALAGEDTRWYWGHEATPLSTA